ncbi:hypothetical protein [Psychroflexus lacisalsi]|uniref:Uncharacterized protein n=1 Tax=Psychroflexus lacisalsi TaxID=503928 RepID=A0ABP3VRU5_9FLAO|nr:hypothetical protein [Psychroflexus lacisalsi]MBZ9620316.1 hypothetical protein [Psychroflexus lacisalsi]
MKREEKNVLAYLKSIEYTDFIYEPSGNRTPDFSIDNDIAVEVRRLNQFHHKKTIRKSAF